MSLKRFFGRLKNKESFIDRSNVVVPEGLGTDLLDVIKFVCTRENIVQLSNISKYSEPYVVLGKTIGEAGGKSPSEFLSELILNKLECVVSIDQSRANMIKDISMGYFGNLARLEAEGKDKEKEKLDL